MAKLSDRIQAALVGLEMCRVLEAFYHALRLFKTARHTLELFPGERSRASASSRLSIGSESSRWLIFR